MEQGSKLNRRVLLGLAAQSAAFTWTTGTLKASSSSEDSSGGAAEDRLRRSFDVRMRAAIADRNAGMPAQITNGDESRYGNHSGNFSKGLPHNAIGEVDPAAYQSLLTAVSSGSPQDFDRIVMGGKVKLANPQSGLAFDLEGLDSHQFAIGPPPALASAQRAGEAVELYWMALMRDTNFADYATDPLAQAACAEISRLSDFRGPKQSGKVTPQTLFRGFTPGDVAGPHISQFLLKPFEYGAIHVDQKVNVYLPLNAGGTDYATDPVSWRAVQNGAGGFGANRIDPVRRYIRNSRDLSAYVHIDAMVEAFMNACFWLSDHGAPLNTGNPYRTSTNQGAFATFGAPFLHAVVTEVGLRALKAAWYQKWFVHRPLRPEEFGGRLHFTRTAAAQYPLHSDILHSEAADRVAARTGSWFLPQAYPEGCPQHPTYAAGHAAVAGACATAIKAFFEDTAPMADVVQASSDGLSLVPYTGSDGSPLTIGGELDKLVGNIGIGRNHAGVHWRSDYVDSTLLGEAVAISLLRDQKATYNEPFVGYTFTRFDGTRITV